MARTPLILFGTGNVARIAHFYFSRDSAYEVKAFTCQRAHLPDEPMLLGLPVIAWDELAQHYPPSRAEAFVAIGYHRQNRTREERINQCKTAGYTLANYVCSKALHWGDTTLGGNVLVMEGVILQPAITLGEGVMIGRGASIGHDSMIEPCAFVGNHAVLCGYNRVGERSFIGSNSTVADGITIAPDTLVGAHGFIKTHTQPGDVFVTPQTPTADPRMRALYQW